MLKELTNMERNYKMKQGAKTLEIFFSLKLKLPHEKAFQRFLQMQANRIMQGYCRYGVPGNAYQYLTRMEKELEVYKRIGNREQLINIANYAFLESYEPEHPEHHHDTSLGSVTRKKVL